MKILALLALVPVGLAAQTTIINGGRTILGPWDAHSATKTLPSRTGNGSPNGRDACVTTGETYFQNDAAAGSNSWACTTPGTPGTWTLQGSGGGGGGGVTSIATTCGISGGTITTTGTVSGNEAVNPQAGAGSYAIQNSDCGKLIFRNQASAVADTIAQAGSSGNFLSGWYLDYQCKGAGGCTITPTTSTIDGAANLTLTSGQGVRIVSDASNYFTQRGVGSGAAVTIGASSPIAASGAGCSPNTAGTCTLSLTPPVSAAIGGTGQTTYTKGDLLATPGGATLNRLPVGSDGFILTADSTATNGFRWGSVGSGTVTSVSFTGGIVSVANPTTTPAFTVAGTTGGIPYFSGATSWASSATWTANTLMKGGGAGSTPIVTGITVDSSNNVSTPGSYTAGAGGSAAGFVNFGQGTGPSTSTTSVTLYGGTSITSYTMRLPSAAATGIYRGANTAGDVVMSQSELSGDATTSGSNAVTVVKVNGGSLPISASALATNGSGQIIVGSGGGGCGTTPYSSLISGATTSNGNLGCGLTYVSTLHTDFTAASTTQSIKLGTAATLYNFSGARIEVTTQATSSGSPTSLIACLGTVAGDCAYTPGGVSVLGSSGTFATFAGNYSAAANATATQDIYLTLTAVGANLSTITAGVATVRLWGGVAQ